MTSRDKTLDGGSQKVNSDLHQQNRPHKTVLPPLKQPLNLQYNLPNNQMHVIPFNNGMHNFPHIHQPPYTSPMILPSLDQLNFESSYKLMPKLTSPEQYISQVNQRQFQQSFQSQPPDFLSYAPHHSSFGVPPITATTQNVKIIPNINDQYQNSIHARQVLPYKLISSNKNHQEMKQNQKLLNDDQIINPYNISVGQEKNALIGYKKTKEESISSTETHDANTREKTLKFRKKPLLTEKLANIICPICHRMFNRQSSYQNHKNTHTGARPFVCKVCGKSFNASPNLSRHKKIHVKNKKIK
ncbi:hypothetical protein QEN19_001051 [Hanseniaspora menglaensis]